MELTDATVLVTGGAGLVGSHLAETLVPDNEVVVADDFSKGSPDNVPDRARLVRADLTDREAVADVVSPELDVVFHLAAKTDTADDDRTSYEANTAMTHNLLEAMRREGVDKFVFTSSSTVYGEAPLPTPEDYAPLEPISLYGAAKLADEALVSTFAHSYGIRSWVVRFANVIGPGQRGNVVPDFIQKLQENPETLTILGDGRQEKSYLHVTDCVDAMHHVVEHADAQLNTYNLGTRTTTSVTTIADIVSEELGLDPEYDFTGGERGWTGDVPRMRLSIEKLAALGWEPTLSSQEAIRRGTRELAAELT